MLAIGRGEAPLPVYIGGTFFLCHWKGEAPLPVYIGDTFFLCHWWGFLVSWIHYGPRKGGSNKKVKQANKGKQPPAKLLAEPSPSSSDDEFEDPIQHLEALVWKHGGPILQAESVVGGKKPRQVTNRSFQAQVLANLVVLEDDSGETSTSGQAAGDGGALGSGQPVVESSKDANQVAVYKGLQLMDGKSGGGPPVTTLWPLGLVQQGSSSGFQQQQQLVPADPPG